MVQEVIDDRAVEEAKIFLKLRVTVVIEVSTFESVFQLMDVGENLVPRENVVTNGHVEGVDKAECSVLLFHEEQITGLLVMCLSMILMCWGSEANNFQHNKPP